MLVIPILITPCEKVELALIALRGVPQQATCDACATLEGL